MGKAIAIIFSMVVIIIFTFFINRHLSTPSTNFTQKAIVTTSTNQANDHKIEQADNQKALTLNNGRNLSVISDKPQHQATVSELLNKAKQIRVCSNIPQTDEEFSAWLETAYQINELPDRIVDVTNKYNKCKSNPDRNALYLDFVISAAEKGSEDAISWLWFIDGSELIKQLNLKNYKREEQRRIKQQFIELKYYLSETAALNLNETAILKLSNAYQHLDPKTGGQNYVKSLAYSDFFMQITKSNDLYGKVKWQRDRLEQRMTHDEIEQALILTEQLLNDAQNTLAQ
ncbi:hypothetical protein ORJ66_21000 [Pseudoalteromonas tunicata]|uniref:hypothetical protein n=1 Tax=Pseudoalteromonas tunicata TaxID=314281 RepID=UPI00273E7ABF|nr:hypothetical protein [Pseudoalteromonas tunicata]MDP5215526.1 hypothetical protein [Pseudoalteromonas tunicata]